MVFGNEWFLVEAPDFQSGERGFPSLAAKAQWRSSALALAQARECAQEGYTPTTDLTLGFTHSGAASTRSLNRAEEYGNSSGANTNPAFTGLFQMYSTCW